MVGTCIQETLQQKYVFEDLSTESGVDVRNYDQVVTRIKESSSNIVLHLAAKTNVDACEEDKTADASHLSARGMQPDDFGLLDWHEWQEKNTAYAVNVVGTLNIARACKETGKKLIYVSTDFVFDGKKDTMYQEEDEPNPLSHYARTKWWGEQVVRKVHEDYIIVRFAYPYGTHHAVKKDFVRIIQARMALGEKVSGVTDQIITPSFAPDIAHALDNLMRHSVSNQTFHLVGSSSLSPYDIAVAIATQFGYDTQIIEKIRAREYYKDRAPRPQFLRVSNEKIVKRGVEMKTFQEGLRAIS